MSDQARYALKNIVERAVYMAQGGVLSASAVDVALPPEAVAATHVAGLAFEDDPRLALPDRVWCHNRIG